MVLYFCFYFLTHELERNLVGSPRFQFFFELSKLPVLNIGSFFQFTLYWKDLCKSSLYSDNTDPCHIIIFSQFFICPLTYSILMPYNFFQSLCSQIYQIFFQELYLWWCLWKGLLQPTFIKMFAYICCF